MARTSQIQWRALSRRTVVIRSLACAAGAAASLAPVNEASAKMAQKSVEYQDTPKGELGLVLGRSLTLRVSPSAE
jgi:hypothetical protein